MKHSHDHHASDTHSHHSVPHSFNIAFAISVTLNFTFTLVQVFYALSANSMSLLADAGHNFGDVLGLIFAWGASWIMMLPARKRYSYGFKRISIIAAIINALILVTTSALISYESIYKLFHMTHVNEMTVIIVAAIGIFVNGGTALLFQSGAREDLNIKGAFLHLLSDAFISFGVVIGAVLIYLTGKMWIDPFIGLMIVITILWNAWGLLRDSVNLILDGIPHYIDHRGIKEYLETIPGVVAIHDLHIWGLSTKETALTAHLVMPEKTPSDAEYRTINHTLRHKFKINHCTIQVEKGSIEHPCEQNGPC